MSALARWEAFLGQIADRHHRVIAEAEVAGRSFIASVVAGGDVVPLSHQLMGVESRLQELETAIIDTWHAKVEDAIFAEDLGVAVRDAEYLKGEAVKDRLEDARDELSPRLHAELAQLRFEHALATTRAIYCSFCGAPGPRPLSFRAMELRCPTCQAATVFDPGELMRSVAAVGTHAVAQMAAIGEWRAMKTADRRARRIRPPVPLAAIVADEQGQITYWRAYLSVRADFEPELGRDLGMEIRSRMEQWYVSHAEFEEEWVRAGRPRTPV